jgi:hypothetical protein
VGDSRISEITLPAQPVDATQALNLSAGVSNCKVSRGRSLADFFEMDDDRSVSKKDNAWSSWPSPTVMALI